jgi:hypothetical protein
MQHRIPSNSGIQLLALLAAGIPIGVAAAAPHETVLYRFHGGADGFFPASRLIADAAGNLYGTSSVGGGTPCHFYAEHGCGLVFELAPPASGKGAWSETILYRFEGGSDGAFPGTLVRRADGTLYGLTAVGGGGGVCEKAQKGCGTVFSLSPPAVAGGAWTEHVLYSFTGGVDGGVPTGLLAATTKGNFVGTAETGGAACGCGVVFSLAPPAVQGGAWTQTVLYAFTGIPPHSKIGDGASPMGVIYDGAGNLVGATVYGGQIQGGQGGGEFGTVFRLAPPAGGGTGWTETVLYRFNINEQNPVSSLAIDTQGELFGTTYLMAYEVIAGTVAPIATFSEGTPSGYDPYGGVIPDSAGDLYGTTLGSGEGGNGLVFRLRRPARQTEPWREQVLHGFSGPPDGSAPAGPVTLMDGALFGTTLRGGNSGCRIDGGVGCGTVFSLKLPPT